MLCQSMQHPQLLLLGPQGGVPRRIRNWGESLLPAELLSLTAADPVQMKCWPTLLWHTPHLPHDQELPAWSPRFACLGSWSDSEGWSCSSHLGLGQGTERGPWLRSVACPSRECRVSDRNRSTEFGRSPRFRRAVPELLRTVDSSSNSTSSSGAEDERVERPRASCRRSSPAAGGCFCTSVSRSFLTAPQRRRSCVRRRSLSCTCSACGCRRLDSRSARPVSPPALPPPTRTAGPVCPSLPDARCWSVELLLRSTSVSPPLGHSRHCSSLELWFSERRFELECRLDSRVTDGQRKTVDYRVEEAMIDFESRRTNGIQDDGHTDLLAESPLPWRGNLFSTNCRFHKARWQSLFVRDRSEDQELSLWSRPHLSRWPELRTPRARRCDRVTSPAKRFTGSIIRLSWSEGCSSFTQNESLFHSSAAGRHRGQGCSSNPSTLARVARLAAFRG